MFSHTYILPSDPSISPHYTNIPFFSYTYLPSLICQSQITIATTVVSANHVEAPQGNPKVVFFRRDRVGELCSLLFLQLFQPHVFQVCSSMWCLNATHSIASLTCIVPAAYSNQYTQPRSSPGRYDLNQQALYNHWPGNTCKSFKSQRIRTLAAMSFLVSFC